METTKPTLSDPLCPKFSYGNSFLISLSFTQFLKTLLILKKNSAQLETLPRVSTFLCIFGILYPNISILSTSLVASVVEYIGTHAHQQSPCTRLSLIFTYSKSPLSLAFVECRRAYHIPTAAEGKVCVLSAYCTVP